jgi:hypothetical protein
VITGLGAVTPLGNDVRSSWQNLVAGRAAAGPITAFDTTGFAVTFACEAKGFEPTQRMERKQARRMDRFAQMIVAAVSGGDRVAADRWAQKALTTRTSTRSRRARQSSGRVPLSPAVVALDSSDRKAEHGLVGDGTQTRRHCSW